MSKESISRRQFVKLAALGLGSGVMTACNAPFYNKPEGNKPVASPNATDTFKAPSPTPTLTSTPEPTPTPDIRTYFEKYVYPALQEVAYKKREEKAENDPDFLHRVDGELNQNRINFALLGIGSERLLTDSNQIMSLDAKTGEIRIVSLFRAVQAPEVSRYKETTKPYYVNQALFHGGIPLVETIIENATGLSADFVVAMQMDVLSSAVKKVFDNKLDVCIPWEISDLNMGYFPAGLQTLNGDEVLRVSRARYYSTDFERQAIQQYVLRAIFRRFKEELSSGPIAATKLIYNSIQFFDDETNSGNVQTNFDKSVFTDIAKELVEKIFSEGIGKMDSMGMPYLAGRYALKAEHMGDPYDTQRRKPIGGNPLAEDLVTGYWFSSRQETKDFLTIPLDVSGYELEEEVCNISQ